MIDPLARLRDCPRRHVVGLNSGTSLDGIDAGLFEIEGQGPGARLRLVRFESQPFPPRIREGLRDLLGLSLPQVAEWNRRLGELFADAVDHLIEGVDEVAQPDLVGSHGLTVFHRPPRRLGEIGETLQLGCPSILAERLGCPIVSNFRAADIAAGGQGAPLAPYLDHLLLHHRPGTLALNLGGIANVSWVCEALEEMVAFDIGPANLPLDRIAHRLSRGESEFDPEGRMAALGRIDGILMDRLCAHPFLHRAPPKTTGREEFGEAWIDEIVARHQHLKLGDILATLTAFVAKNIGDAVREWIEPRSVREMLVSGGGVHNATLMERLRRELPGLSIRPWRDELAFDPDAKEAALFALLANDRLFGLPGNVPAATGARWPTRLGVMTW